MPPSAHERSPRLLALIAGLLLALSVLLALSAPATAQSTDDLMGGSPPEETAPSGGSGLDDSSGGLEETPDETGSTGEACSWFPPDFGCIAVKSMLAIFGMLWEDGIEKGIEELQEALTKSAFGLPAPSGELTARYDGLVEKVKPGILVGVLLLGLMMMLRSANYNVAYTTQHGLPKLVFVAAALAFFPDFMKMVADLSGGMATEFVGESQISGAVRDLIDAGMKNGGPLSIFMIIGQVCVLAVGFLVVAVAILKNIAFSILFIMGPLALILYPVPGFANVAGAWFRGIVACVAIPLIYSVEVTVGSWIVKAPELIFGSAGGALSVFKIIAAVMLLWIMWKTPFKALEWAFHSYSSSSGGGRGLVSGVVKGVATGLAVGYAKEALGLGKAARGTMSPEGAKTTNIRALQAQTNRALQAHPQSQTGAQHAASFQALMRDSNERHAIRGASAVAGIYRSGGSSRQSPGLPSALPPASSPEGGHVENLERQRIGQMFFGPDGGRPARPEGGAPKGGGGGRPSTRPQRDVPPPSTDRPGRPASPGNPAPRSVAAPAEPLRWERGPGGQRGVVLDPKGAKPQNGRGD